MKPLNSLVSRLILLTSLGCGVSSCATPGTSSFGYTEPAADMVKNEIVVSKPFSDAWDVLVGELAKSFFVINNVEKASRIINVSFSTDNPKDYVDCGRSKRTFEMDQESAVYEYAVSESSSFKLAAKWGPLNNLPAVMNVFRKPSLEGRVNIYVAPKDNSTVVTANARFVFSVKSSGIAEYRNAFGTVERTTP